MMFVLFIFYIIALPHKCDLSGKIEANVLKIQIQANTLFDSFNGALSFSLAEGLAHKI